MGRRPSIAWLIWVRNFGFTSKRKYGFLHSTWEVIIARRTGTTYSILDYVVYRLFYVLTLCGASVYKLSQVNPLPFLIYFETWALFAHTIYSFLFLRQVLVHNHHRKALGRRQKMPDQLVITDEIERNGHKYYISKKISVLPRDNLSAYEKLVWVMFNISATMSFVSLAVTAGTPPFLVRRHPKGKPYPPKFDHFVLVTLGFIMTLVDIVVNTLPMRIGHFIYSILFCLLYFLIAYFYDTAKKGKIHLYQDDIWNYPKNLKILGIAVISHICVVLLSQLRDWVVSLLDRSRAAANQQKVRTQKRLARRKIMVPIYGVDGKVNRIMLEHSAGAPGGQEDWIYWKDGHHDEREIDEWAGDSAGSNEGVEERVVLSNVNEDEVDANNVVTLDESSRVKVVKHPSILMKQYGPPPDLTATTDLKPIIKVTSDKRRIENVRLPSPPRGNNKGLRRTVGPAVHGARHPLFQQQQRKRESGDHQPRPFHLVKGPRPDVAGAGGTAALNSKPVWTKKDPLPSSSSPPRSPPTPPKQQKHGRNNGILKNYDEIQNDQVERGMATTRPEQQDLDLDKIATKALIDAYKREYNAKLANKKVLVRPDVHGHLPPIPNAPKRDSQPDNGARGGVDQKKINLSHPAEDANFEAEKRKYGKSHHVHEIDRLAYHTNQKEMHNVGAGEKKKGNDHNKSSNNKEPQAPRARRTTIEAAVFDHVVIEKRKDGSGGSEINEETEEQEHVEKVHRPAKKRVYNAALTPKLPHATISFHLLGSKLDRRGGEEKLAPKQVSQLRGHPGIHTTHGLGHIHTKDAAPLKEKESKIVFHPLIQFYDIPHPQTPPDAEQVHAPRRKSHNAKNHGKQENLTRAANPNLHKFDHFEPDTQFTGHPPPNRGDDENDGDAETRGGGGYSRGGGGGGRTGRQ